MPTYEIKPKPRLSPIEYSARFATEADIAEARERSGKQASGCALTVIGVCAFGIGLYVWSEVYHQPMFGTWLVLLATVAAPWLAAKVIEHSAYSGNLEKIVTARLRAVESRIQQKENEAVSVALSTANTIYDTHRNELITLHELLVKTEVLLNQAQQLFAERAYTPFWDSIEDAVELLRQFDKRVGLIKNSAKEYYANLEGREHTFPAFPLNSKDLPNPKALFDQLTHRIAEAQRDFQFSSIFEQRRTTSAIVKGFRNTQEAIVSLRDDLVSSLSDLQNSLESELESMSSNVREGIDNLAERHEQSVAELGKTLDGQAERDSKHQKFIEDALDNIQNRRRPRSSETKAPFRKDGD